MNKVRVKNSLVSKVIVIIVIVIFVIFLFVLSISVLIKDKNNNVFDLGESNSSFGYSDKVINDYNEMINILKEYNVDYIVKESDFEGSSYVLLFQDYNPCSESKYKTIEEVTINKNINVTLRVHSKCGWCKKHMVLYIIKVDKVPNDTSIEYKYIFPNKQVNCGNVK